MKNFKIENDMDFYAELKKELDKVDENTNSEVEDDNICLLTKQKLENNYITLSCNHRFNYVPLYNEICKQKMRNHLETTILYLNEIKCPYCRSITAKLLPYLACFDKNVHIKRGVNSPEKYCMKIYECEWKIKSGKNRNKDCGNSAYKTNNGVFCFHHHLLTNVKRKCVSVVIEWTKEHEEINKRYKLLELKEILRKNSVKVSGTKKILVNRYIINKI